MFQCVRGCFLLAHHSGSFCLEFTFVKARPLRFDTLGAYFCPEMLKQAKATSKQTSRAARIKTACNAMWCTNCGVVCGFLLVSMSCVPTEGSKSRNYGVPRRLQAKGEMRPVILKPGQPRSAAAPLHARVRCAGGPCMSSNVRANITSHDLILQHVPDRPS